MKKLLAFSIAALLVGAVGCSSSTGTGKKSTEPGVTTHPAGESTTHHASGEPTTHQAGPGTTTLTGPGTTKPAVPPPPPATKKVEIDLKGDDLKVEVDKGKEKAVPIKIKRTDYDGEVKLSVKAAEGTGLTADPATVVIPAKESSGSVKIKADANAKGGKVTVSIEAAGDAKPGSSVDLDVKTK
jgi:hypothetical protein